VPIPAKHVEAVHGVKASASSKVAFHVPFAHTVQVPVAVADPDPIQHLFVGHVHVVTAPPAEVSLVGQAVQSAVAVTCLVLVPTMLFAAQVVAVHGVKAPASSKVAFHVPAVHSVQVPVAVADPDPIQHFPVGHVHVVTAPPAEVSLVGQAVQSAVAVTCLVLVPTMLFAAQVVAVHGV